MKYRVTVHGEPFEVEVVETGGETRARVSRAPAPGHAGQVMPGHASPLDAASLVSHRGPLGALVSEHGSLPVSVEKSVEESVYFVRLPGGRPLRCEVEDERARLAHARSGPGGAGGSGPRTIRAVMPGIVVKVLVEPGETVHAKSSLLVVEAMKMQNEIRAESSGTIAKVHVKPGQSIAAGAPLVDLAPVESSGA